MDANVACQDRDLCQAIPGVPCQVMAYTAASRLRGPSTSSTLMLRAGTAGPATTGALGTSGETGAYGAWAELQGLPGGDAVEIECLGRELCDQKHD